MNKTFPGLLIVCGALFLGACSNKQKDLSDTEIHAKVDSIVGSRIEEINRQAMEDLDHRMAIEVKAKADSIVQSHMQPAQTPPPPPEMQRDSLHNRPMPMPRPAAVPIQHPAAEK